MTVHGIPDACSQLGCYCPSKESNAFWGIQRKQWQCKGVSSRGPRLERKFVFFAAVQVYMDKQLFKFTLARHNQPVAAQGKWSFIISAMPTYNLPRVLKICGSVIHIATFWSVFNRLQDCFGNFTVSQTVACPHVPLQYHIVPPTIPPSRSWTRFLTFRQTPSPIKRSWSLTPMMTHKTYWQLLLLWPRHAGTYFWGNLGMQEYTDLLCGLENVYRIVNISI